MQRRLFAGLLVLLPTLAMAEGARELETFGDWVVGCDDSLFCTAIGMSKDMAETQAYLRLTRGPDADAEPAVSLSLGWWDRPEGTDQPDFLLSLEGDGGQLATDRLGSEDSGSTLHADLKGTDPAVFLRGLLPAKTLRIDTQGGATGASISLSGMSAALRWMDAAQGRDGGETALVATGPAPGSAVPAPNVVAAVKAVAMTELDPAPPAPAGAPERDEFCNEYATNVAYGLADGRMVYGVCAFNGAYNIGYSYVLVSADGATVEPLHFPGPDGTSDTPDPILVNAGLSDDGKAIVAFNKGRGLSDCGDSGEWVFDGTAFRVVSYALMPECRGVSPEDWPVIVSVPVE